VSTSARETYHHGDLRTALLNAAMTMLEAGEPFSLRAIARRAGVSQTAPYRHFADREAIESALAVQGFVDLRHRLSNDGETAGTQEELIGFAITYTAFALERPALFRLMFGQECDPTDDERVRASQALHTVLEDSLRKVFPTADHSALATALWALVHGLAFLHVDGKLPATSAEEVAARVRGAFTALTTAFAYPRTTQ
jgi:AcrR family transcriptional regulator